MGKFTITIAEEDGGLSIDMEGDGQPGGVAGLTAMVLMRLAPDVVAKAARRASNKDCQCEKCKAAREEQAEASATEGKPTIH
ncbi:hypothetical protein [Pseudomonas citronellolis]|uniref:hypothetical protein n=1 Tax=Pseudomonas citronellolis TaxID=53408 RepID=UPI00248D60A3|nr:hypothetical protein [Pseudomonas citronellolis]